MVFFVNKGGIAKTSELPQNAIVTDEQLLKEMLPRGIICVESALFHYRYSDFSPRKWSVAVPRTASRTVKRLQEIPLKPYFIQKNLFNLGKTIDILNGISLAVYDRERTLCDCFKYHTKLDNVVQTKKMPDSRFLTQNDRFDFNELVQASSLASFTSDLAEKYIEVAPGRTNMLISDKEATVTYYLVCKAENKKEFISLFSAL